MGNLEFMSWGDRFGEERSERMKMRGSIRGESINIPFYHRTKRIHYSTSRKKERYVSDFLRDDALVSELSYQHYDQRLKI